MVVVTDKTIKIETFEEESYKVFEKNYSSQRCVLGIEIDSKLYGAIRRNEVHINEADAACMLRYYRTMPYIPELYATIFRCIR